MALENGSDGIYLFNFMGLRNKRKMPEIFSECGSLKTLRGKNFSLDISYDDLDMDEGTFLNGWRAEDSDAYFSKWRRQLKDSGKYPYQLPRELSPGESSVFTFDTGRVPEESPLLACSFEGLGKADVQINGIPCSFREGRYVVGINSFPWTKAEVMVTNREKETVEIQRVSLHFSWDGTFPELFDPDKIFTVGVAANI